MSMTYEKFLENILWIFNIEEIDGEYRNSNGVVNLSIEHLQEHFNLVQSLESNQCKLYYENEDDKICEVALMGDPFFLKRMGLEKLVDVTNHVEYEINEPTEIYMVWAVKEIFELKYISNNNYLKILKRRIILTNGLDKRFGNEEDSDISEINVYKLLGMLCRFNTLKVTKKHNSTVDLADAIDSYCYTYMRNMQRSIKVYSLEDVFSLAYNGKVNPNTDFEVPKKYYNSSLIDYYNLALSSTDPFVRFISYYHVIEYFYDEVFKEHQIESVKKVITSPTFSYKDEEKIYSIVKTIIKDSKLIKEHGGGNEQQSLNYVLKKHINDLEEFKSRLLDEDIDYYQNHNVAFSKGDKINWSSNEDKIINSIGNRIYKTRNSLIHSKSSKKDETYHPYEDRKHLDKEIPLIKSIAETIIEYNAKYI